MRFTLQLSILLLTCLLLLNHAISSERHIQSFDLEHRSALEVSSQLQPHLSDQVRISHQGQRLILSGPADELTSLRQLIGELDQPLQNYRVLLVRSTSNLAEQRPGRHISTQRQQVEQLRLIEGSTARLNQDFYLPLTSTHSSGRPTEEGYFHLQAGTHVTVQPQGQRVLLTFSTQQAAPRTQQRRPSLSNQQAEKWAVSGVASSLLITPGEWISAAAQEAGQQQSSSSSQRRTTAQGIFYNLCVEQEGQGSCGF
ncbi:hypothetical protein V6U78_12015 [Marinospirillum sp. MEB164]|uniref:Secretin n=1 Tax=Marinospirillum alkalitolerans TaxID=3123374 RepID=A0ABW8Q1P3_9GAMM